MKNGKTWAKIIKSPYSSIPNGTCAEIEKVRVFKDGTRLYITKGLANNIFRPHEIERITPPAQSG